MRSYKVPENLHGEEKLIGGVASLRQAIYVLLASAIGLGVAAIMPVEMVGKITVFAVFPMIGIGFGFTKIHDINLDSFVVMYFKYLTRKRKFCYQRRKRKW
jgi:hypothetical protein